MTNLDEINKTLEIPEEDKYTPIKESEAKFIYDFIKKHNITKTLEIGFAYARSASHIISATNSMHIAMDPFQENYGSRGLKNIEKLGLKDKLTFLPEFSHDVLPRLKAEKKKFEFIFIDGDHKFDGIFIDFYYSDFLINKGGFLLFHDTWMRSTQLAINFIRKNRTDYKEISTPLRNLSLFTKISDSDERNGMHFKGFYTFKSLFKHNLILWMSSDSSNPIKKIVLKLKDIVK